MITYYAGNILCVGKVVSERTTSLSLRSPTLEAPSSVVSTWLLSFEAPCCVLCGALAPAVASTSRGPIRSMSANLHTSCLHSCRASGVIFIRKLRGASGLLLVGQTVIVIGHATAASTTALILSCRGPVDRSTERHSSSSKGNGEVEPE